VDVRPASSLTALVIIAAAALTAACGSQNATGGGLSASPKVSVLPVAGGSATCRPARPAGPDHTVTVGASDNGKSVCVKPGTAVMVILRGTPDRKWAPIHASSRALVPRGNGRLMLMMGATGAYFVAARPGTAVISSARPACAPASGGAASCGAKVAFHTTVVVHR
jgi:hypothetical protein